MNRNSVLLCLKKYKTGGIEHALYDKPGRGRNSEITDEEKSWIINIACQKPVDFGYAAETWTYARLTRHVNETAEHAGYHRLTTITKTSIKNILDAAEIKPFRIQYYCEKRDPDFESKMHQVLLVYKQVEMLFDDNGELYVPAEEQDVHTISYDEKPGIRAIATTSPDLMPNQNNGTIKRDYEYKRLGTLSLLAAIDLLTGEAIPLMRNTHRSEDFIDFLKTIDERYPTGDLIQVILDNHSVHTSKKVKQFLSTMPGRFAFVFTPKHGSWLNMIEGFFGKNVSKAFGELGTAMGLLSEGIADIDTIRTKFDEASSFLTTDFKDFYDDVVGMGKIKYTDQMKALLTMLGDYGTNLSKFDIGLTGANITELDTAATVIVRLMEAVKMAQDITILDISDMGFMLDEYSKLNIKGFFEAFSKSVYDSGLNSDILADLNTAATIIDTLMYVASTAGYLNTDDILHVGELLEEYGNLSIENFVVGFNNATAQAVLAMNGLLEQLSQAITGDSAVSAAATTLSTNAATAVRNTRSNWHRAGENLGAGLADGIAATTDWVRGAASALADAALNEIGHIWIVNSPSRAAAELGMYFDLGLANGLDQYAYRVKQSSVGLGENVLTSAQAVMNRMGQVTDGIDSQPTIRPVIDLTDIANGMNTLDGMFSGTHVVSGSFFSGMNGMRSARALLEQQGEVRIQNGNRDVVDRLDRLSEQFDLISEELANMQIVLDSGVLVGQTSGKMDTQLGVMASRRRRGN